MNEPASPQMQSLLAAIPDDPFAAFVLSDYLEEQNDADGRLQGELLRLVYALTRSVEIEGRARREERLRTLLSQGVRAVGPYRRIELGEGVAMEFAWVPPGVFLMGSPPDEEGRITEEAPRSSRLGEGPRHEVTLTRGFWMGTTPVTQIQYVRVVDHNPSWDSSREVDVEAENRDKPVQEVTWYDAVGFLGRLSKRVERTEAGLRFRLPTEAEWEYACRAGTTTRFWSGNSEADLARVGWYGENSDREMGVKSDDWHMHPVGKAANALGLYDMHGNVWEWCVDLYDENYYARSPIKNPRCKRGETEQRVMRGGDAWDDAANCRSAARNSNHADCSHNDISFRVVADRL